MYPIISVKKFLLSPGNWDTSDNPQIVQLDQEIEAAQKELRELQQKRDGAFVKVVLDYAKDQPLPDPVRESLAESKPHREGLAALLRH